MSMQFSARQTIISRFVDGAVSQLEAAGTGIKAIFAAMRARQAAQQTADELARLDPAILADIGIAPLNTTSTWSSMGPSHPHSLAASIIHRGTTYK